jgi:hypothetical protein
VNKLKQAFEIARFVLFIVTSVKALVLSAEEQLPESGKGSEKFAAVKQAIIMAARYADIASDIITTLDQYIDEQIDSAVSKWVNGNES